MTFDMAGHTSTLMKLGFSSNQAKVYLAIVILGTPSINGIMKLSGVPREEVYRKLQELQERGFVEHIFARPFMFRATPLECVITTMLKLKAEEISKLQIKTEELLRDFENSQKRETLEADKPQIILIPERRPLLERAKKELESFKNSLDTISSWKKGINWISSHYDLFMKALDRNAKIRFIIEKTEESRFPRFVEELQNNPLFQIKTIQALPPACIAIYDQKILFIDTSVKTTFIESPVLWSNNSNIVGMAQIYFETLWSNFEIRV